MDLLQLSFFSNSNLLFLFFNISQSIGAVNCIVRRNNGKLFGCNTDYVGAISAIEDGLRGFFHDSLATLTIYT